MARRGRRHAFERLSPATTALVVVDMVPFFVLENPYCAGVVPQINALAHALRQAGGVVAWVLPSSDDPFAAVSKEFFGPQVAETYRTSGGFGPLPARLAAGLGHEPDDVFVEKSAASAFFPGRCTLPDILAGRGVRTVIVTGTVTNVCCEATVRDARTLGYRVIMVADANATVRDEMHNASLTAVYRSFGDVRPTADVLALIAAG
ncbi:MAG: cysteine hydrolase [Phenylobacterium sp.]|uniref:cysteine hydrolase n=1 Tax=Phenylobacterium sp. TaxID=1871053 RepID=UPI001A485369|nr:cysteine hydrolase [Phenylobacterium sp.]MBL8771279.1 cysteine hydrolase [Phenylobacterium sp.]